MRPTAALAALLATAAAAVPAAAGVPVAAAQDPDPDVTLHDTLYVLPLGRAAATPECALVLCPFAQPFEPVGSGPDAGVAGLRASGVPLLPGRVVAEARSLPMPYDGAGGAGTASATLAADRVAEGAGGTVTAAVRLEEQGGGIVGVLPAAPVPLDGVRRTGGPVPIDLAGLRPGRSYVAVARFEITAPAGSSVSARIFAPRLLALGPRRAPKAPPVLRPRAPVVRLNGRRLRVTVACPTGSRRCELQVRASLRGRTLAKGSRREQAGAGHTFDLRLSAADLRRARRAGRIAVALRVVVEKGGGAGEVRASVRVPRR